jgi:hypothetical protein
LRLKAFRPMRVYEITLSREAQTLSMSRQAVSNSNQCIPVGTACDHGIGCANDAAVDGRVAQKAAVGQSLIERVNSLNESTHAEQAQK